jgi:hypothetical protein
MAGRKEAFVASSFGNMTADRATIAQYTAMQHL